MKNRGRITQTIYWALYVVLFVIATVAFLADGEPWYDAYFHAVQLFLMKGSISSDANAVIYICRAVCPIMTTTAIIVFFRGIFNDIMDNAVSGRENATAIYYDDEQMKEVGTRFTCPVLMKKKKINKKTNYHILLLPTDVENLTLYNRMKDKVKKDSKIYIKLEETDSMLLKDSPIHYFNVNEIISRNYWKERTLERYMTDGKVQAKIAILGFGALGQRMLDFGLMNNIYSLDQSIEYHIWGDSELYNSMRGHFDMMNRDEIYYHGKEWKKEIGKLRGFDRVIVTEETDVELLQALLYLDYNTEIDFYNPTGAEFSEIYARKQLFSFGAMNGVLTEENIKTDVLYRAAKEINYAYWVHENPNKYSWNVPDIEIRTEEEWNCLSGFHKGSNLASADYHTIRQVVMKQLGIDKKNLSPEQLEMLSEMEHIRWSRYHFVNHWQFAPVRNNDKRQHPLLKLYAELSEMEKGKDRDAVKRRLEGE